MKDPENLRVFIEQYGQAVQRLEEVLALQKNAIIRDSAIKRFEFTLDLSWKTLKTFLEEKKGVICKSPKECFRLGFQQGQIDYDEYWLTLVDLRNETVHTYKEQIAEEVYSKLPKALQSFRGLLKALMMSEKGVSVKRRKRASS